MNISKINNANAAKIYAETGKNINHSNKSGKKGEVKNAALEKGGVNISREAKSMNILDFAKERIKAELNKEIPAEKVGYFKNMVQSGSYNVATDALASAVIDGKNN